MICLICNAILLFLLSPAFSSADDNYGYTTEVDISKFMLEAILTYKTSFTIKTSMDKWNSALDHPVLMDKIWNSYSFSPAYSICIQDSAIHVVDPTGIEGNIFLIQLGNTKRIYLGIGRMKKWIPFTIIGRVLFKLEYSSGDQIDMSLGIYGERSSNLFENLMVKAFSPILIRMINKRIESNLRDLNSIFTDIGENPEKIRFLLDKDSLNNYEKIFRGIAAENDSTAEGTPKNPN